MLAGDWQEGIYPDDIQSQRSTIPSIDNVNNIHHVWTTIMTVVSQRAL